MHRRAPVPAVSEHVEQGDTIRVGDAALRVLYTPGHTPDSISLHAEDRVYTGDVLLIGGTGRADFAGGDSGQQYDSITRKLFALPDETLVFPAHDYRGNTHSTIGQEKRQNPRIAGRTRDEYVALMASLNFPMPDKIQEVLQPNQSAIDDDKAKFPDLTELNKVRQLTADDVSALLAKSNPPLVLDVREASEYSGELGHIPGSVLIPLRQLFDRAGELDDHKGTSDRRRVPFGRAQHDSGGDALRHGLRAGLQPQGWHGRVERPQAACRAVVTRERARMSGT